MYLKQSFLIEKYNLPTSAVAIGCYRNRQFKTKSWQNKKDPTDKRKVLIDVDTIPDGTRLKYNIPTGKEYRELQLKAFEAQKEQEKIERYQAQLREKELAESVEKTALLMAYNDNWVEYYPIYLERYKERCKDAKTTQKIEQMAKLSAREHAFWLAMIDVTGNKYRSNGGKTQLAYNYFLDLKKELVFSRNFSTYNHFCILLVEPSWMRESQCFILINDTNHDKE